MRIQRTIQPAPHTSEHRVTIDNLSSRAKCWVFVLRSGCKAVAALVICSCILLAPAVANAQITGQGTISGSVDDSSGAVIVDAKITITNVETGVAQVTVTNRTGYFEAGSLPPGQYSISASSTAFETAVRRGVTLLADAHVNIPLILKPGSAAQQIVVTADAPLLNTEGSDSGEVFTTQKLESLPYAGNDPMVAETLAPGVQSLYSQVYDSTSNISQPNFTYMGTFGQLQQNMYSLDGAPNMGESVNAVSINLTGDEVGEMKIDTTGFDPAYGHALGVQLTQVTKNGTNDLHGTVREYYSDLRWRALNHFAALQYYYELKANGCTKGPSTSGQCLGLENQYGNPGVHENSPDATISGPVILPGLFDGRNKLFFFASGLADSLESANPKSIEVPTLQERKGDFSDLPTSTSPPASYTSACGAGTAWYGQYQLYNPFSVTLVNGVPNRSPFCGNIIPANFLTANSAMSTIFNYLDPAPNTGSVIGTNYLYTGLSPESFDGVTLRVDYAVSPSNHTFFRWSKQWYGNVALGYMPDNLDEKVGPRFMQSGTADWTHIFSPSMTLDVTTGLTDFRNDNTHYPGLDKYSPTSLGLPSYLNTYSAPNLTLPIISPKNYTAVGFTSNPPSGTDYRVYALGANLMRLQGHHTIHAGFEMMLQTYSQAGLGNVNGTYTFDDTYTQQNNGTNKSYPTNNSGLAYAAVLLGIPTTSSVAESAPISISSPYYAAYIGDTWRVSRKLTITPGLRYEFELGPSEKHDAQIVGWDPTASLPIAGIAETAYQSALSGATAAQRAVLPASLSIQGGPVYAGVNGASTRQWQNDYRVMPRLGLAYQLTDKTVLRAGYGLIFGTLNALLGPGESKTFTDQDGFSATTSVASSTTYGTNFVEGSTPLSNPFPNGFNSPIGSTAGALYYAGGSPSIYDHSLVPPRAQRGEISIQHQFGTSSMLEVAWLGQLTTDESVEKNEDALPASFYTSGQSMQPNTATNTLQATQIANPFYIGNFSGLASSNPTQYNLIASSSYFSAAKINISKLLSPYPQMNGLNLYLPLGESTFQELQLTFTRRLTQGLSMLASLQVNDDKDSDYFKNQYDARPSWESSNYSAPYRLTLQGTFTLPFGKGEKWATSGLKSAIFGGFRTDFTYELQPGELVTFPNVFYIGPTSAIHLKHKVFVNNGLSSGGYNYIQWFNPGNVTATYSGGVCTYAGQGFVTNSSCQPSYNETSFPTHITGLHNSVRQSGANVVQLKVHRMFHLLPHASNGLAERLTLDTQIDAYDLFNMQIYGTPSTAVTSSQFGQVTGPGDTDGGGDTRWFDVQAVFRF